MKCLLYARIVTCASLYLATLCYLDASQSWNDPWSEYWQERIGGGEIAGNACSVPRIANFSFYNLYKGKFYYCNGVYLSPRWILTAGHCAEYTEQDDAIELCYCTRNGVLQYEQFEVKTNGFKTYLHPAYKRMNERYTNLSKGHLFQGQADIALIRLNRPVGSAFVTLPEMGVGRKCFHEKCKIWSYSRRLEGKSDNHRYFLKTLDINLVKADSCKKAKSVDGDSLAPDPVYQACSFDDLPTPNRLCEDDSGAPVMWDFEHPVTLLGSVFRLCPTTPNRHYVIHTIIGKVVPWIYHILDREGDYELDSSNHLRQNMRRSMSGVVPDIWRDGLVSTIDQHKI